MFYVSHFRQRTFAVPQLNRGILHLHLWQVQQNAKFAFEAIINAFNRNDKKTLKNLLTKNVYQSFEQAIDQGNNNPNFQFYSLVIDNVEESNVDNNTVSITLKITSEQFKDNDESTITKKQDTWTFQREKNSKSPIWLLSST